MQSRYNYPVDEISMRTIFQHLDQIYSLQDVSFKINFSIGVMLQNIETGKYRMFKHLENGDGMPEPMMIANKENLDELKLYFSKYS